MLLHLKKNEDSLFLYETKTSISLDDLVVEITYLYNTRLLIKRLISATQDLVEYGPLKPIAEQGYDEKQMEDMAQGKSPEKKEIVSDGVKYLLNPDPTGRRTGKGISLILQQACCEEYAQIINNTLKDAEAAISKDLVAHNKFMTKTSLEDAINTVRGAIMIAYPQGLPEGETVKDILENNEDLQGSAASKEIIPLENATLWWAGKELVRSKILSDFVGKNEKSKLIVKIQRKGQGAPIREPTVSEQTQKEMMAYYYRKQEEHKKLVENDDDDYVQSPWADPKALKSSFNGIKNIRF